MPKIFISYRRADTQPIVGRIYEHLARAFGADNVFMDVQDIPAGEHFKAYLEQQVTACDVQLVIIGPQWISVAEAEGKRRLDDPDDFVRIEVESGLKRPDVRVVPILIHETQMPASEDLPESLRDLHFRNASRVRYDPDFTADMNKLIWQLGGGSSLRTARASRWRWIAVSLLAALVLLALAILVVGSGALTRLFFPFVEVSQTAQAAMTQRAGTGTAEAIAAGSQTPPPTEEIAAASQTPPPTDEGPAITVLSGASLRQAPEADAPRRALVLADTPATIREISEDGEWLYLVLENGQEGWARRDVLDIEEDFRWRVLFTSPDGNIDRGPDSWSGIDLQFARALDDARSTIDLAAFELDHPLIYEALLNAHQRGVRVRIVTDNEYGLDMAVYQDYLAATTDSARADIAAELNTPLDETYLDELAAAGVEIVDDGRFGLMHHNFAILDGTELWAGSWGYTLTSTYRNNNNVLTLRDANILVRFQAEFERMFVEHIFNQGTPAPALAALAAEGQFATAYFTPGNDDTLPLLLALINSAEHSVRLMLFTFTQDDLGNALVALHARGVQVEGIMEARGSQTQVSEMQRLFCAGANMRSDGNPYILLHKVIIIDDEIVITGSMNLSNSALESNNEDFIVVLDPELAAQYNEEFQRRWAEASVPTDFVCE